MKYIQKYIVFLILDINEDNFNPIPAENILQGYLIKQ